MPTDATGTPTSRGIPKYNTSVDAPSGLGFNAAMDAIDTLIGSVLVASGYGTTLPASPTDGQVFVLVDSLTSPSYQWQLRYNASSTSTYKWEFIGGTSLYALTITTEATTSTSYVDLTTVGPSLTLPRAGVYHTSFGYMAGNNGSNSGGGNAQAAVWSNGAASIVGIAPIVSSIPSVNGVYNTGSIKNGPITFATAGDQIRLKYLISNGLSVNFTGRWIKATPLKVI